ncbi:hypothetical protein [Nocardioides sp. AE5]|uniref:hypothetical protein n=1 Tax=Nocardioides sp. AE5 TaxID=2962573 RepID=UPI0028810D46|nr:hypothetical protein [Nocardioides sp. AE5]MDT0203813.1 hypothetical protein [Nocardioides sp. AE5]
MIHDVRRAHRAHRVRFGACLAGLGLATALLTGCGGEDHSAEVAPIADELRGQPGVAEVEGFYTPQQLKVAESYEVDVRMTEEATSAQACAVLPRFLTAAEATGVDSGIISVTLRHGGPEDVYPYRWMYSLGADDGEPAELEQICLSLQRLRALPDGVSVNARAEGSHTYARIDFPEESVEDLAEARTLVADLMEVEVEDLKKPEVTGFDLRVDLVPA